MRRMHRRQLPTFRYHPDPIKTASVEASDVSCVVCGVGAGYVYTGPVYYADRSIELRDRVCPWCIADGSAAERHAASFTSLGIVPADVTEGVRSEIRRRTPGFIGWQEQRWLYHCADGAEFLGLAEFEDLREYPESIECIVEDYAAAGWSAEEIHEHLVSLSRVGQPTAYLFRCLHCGRGLAYSDFT